MRVLVTNDDGIDAVGLHRIAIELARDDRFDVLVVAPDGDYSGTSASLGATDPAGLGARRVELPDAPSIEAWALGGPPAMCVLAAHLGGFGDPPELVVSGINAGLNTGRAVLHSGTVGAALTAQNFRMSGIAVSLQTGDPWHWDTAAALAMDAVDIVLDSPPRSVLNLNVPDRARGDVLGIRWARLAPFGEVRMSVVGEPGEPDPSGASTRRLSTELVLADVSFDPDTDTGLVRAGHATLTALVGVAEAWPATQDDERSSRPPTLVERVLPGAPLHVTHRVPDADERGSLHRPFVLREPPSGATTV